MLARLYTLASAAWGNPAPGPNPCGAGHTSARRHCWLAALVGLVAAGLAPLAQALPAYDEVRAAWRPSDTVVLDRHGEPLQRLRTDDGARRGQWTALADVSPALREALVFSEDRRFFEHSGVDWRAVSAAAWGNLWNSRTRGASTISMQLAGLLDETWRAGPGGRNPAQKLGQAVAAQVLDRRWRKDQILEAYLNLVPLRGELVGVDAMARSLFGKAPHGLDEREAAVAAALVRAPNAAPARVAQRACALLREMGQGRPAPSTQARLTATAQDPGRATVCDGLQAWTEAALKRREWPAAEGIAPHAARQILRAAAENGAAGNTRLASTLDARLQRLALGLLQRQLRELRQRNVEDGAVIVLDNASGEVLAWVGSSGELSDAPEVDAVLAPRQAGSTLKPFLYAQAIAERRLTAASLLEDSPAQIPTDSGLYIPQNYDRHFKGSVSVRTALGASLNVPAVRTLALVTPQAFGRQLAMLGLPLKEGGDYYGYSLALGSAEVTLASLANAYRALANGGQHSGYTLRRRDAPSAPESGLALDRRAAWIVSDILADSNARARSFGTDSVLATRAWSAVKTGTSKDMRDNWAIGYTRHHTVGVWVGNASGAPMHAVSGVSGAAPVWAALVAELQRARPGQPLPPPPGLVNTRLSYADGSEAARPEWFLPGTAQSLVRRAEAARMAARIAQPAAGTIVALDPDIPPARQRLTLAAQGEIAGGAARWLIDGKPFARGTSAQWMPWPGRHRITLADGHGQVIDEIRLEVRGAGLRGDATGTPVAKQDHPRGASVPSRPRD